MQTQFFLLLMHFTMLSLWINWFRHVYLACLNTASCWFWIWFIKYVRTFLCVLSHVVMPFKPLKNLLLYLPITLKCKNIPHKQLQYLWSSNLKLPLLKTQEQSSEPSVYLFKLLKLKCHLLKRTLCCWNGCLDVSVPWSQQQLPHHVGLQPPLPLLLRGASLCPLRE